MDFSKYKNIEAKVNSLGGVKKALFNKGRMEEAEKSWEQFTPEELEEIDKEFPRARQIYFTIVTSRAICVYNAHTFTAIPVKDVLWVYSNVVTQKMNFIPCSKIHTIILLARNGQSYTLGMTTTGGFSKKMPTEEKISQMREFLNKYRKGIVYGYSDEIAQLFALDFGKACAMIDEKSNESSEE